MFGYLLKKEFQILVNFQIIGFCSFNKTVNDSTGFGSVNSVNYVPVSSADRKRSDRSFGRGVVYRNHAVLKKRL